jgi:hypothetical protein
MNRLTLAIALYAAAGLALAACAPASVKAPTDRKVCFHMQPLKEGGARFNKLADNVADLEHCALELERMRLNFLRMGGSNSEITGSYQGQFLFLRPQGIFTAQSLTAPKYVALVRVGDQLVKPGAVPQQ